MELILSATTGGQKSGSVPSSTSAATVKNNARVLLPGHHSRFVHLQLQLHQASDEDAERALSLLTARHTPLDASVAFTG
jgi:hypothetical protein